MKKLLVLVLFLAPVPAWAADRAAVNRAIEKGVAALRRRANNDNNAVRAVFPGGAAFDPAHDVAGQNIGAAALVALTLLECGVSPDDPQVKRAAETVREASVTLTYTYAVSLSILLLDRLGDSRDVPLIESLTVRLMAGQDAMGGWSYSCPAISENETRRLRSGLDGRKDKKAEGEDRPKAAKKDGKRSPEDLPEEIKTQLKQIDGAAAHNNAFAVNRISDNSNTQFAALALWVGRRHGLPVERAVARLDERFRSSQEDDGGWGYLPRMGSGRPPIGGAGGMIVKPPGIGSEAAMTCAGLLGLAIANGTALEWRNEHASSKKKRLPDISKDAQLKKGLLALSSVIGTPIKIDIRRPGPPGPGGGAPGDGANFLAERARRRVAGRTFYFLWSLERVAVALDLETIGKKDWYSWGAEILLANQQADGSWDGGEYGVYGADTCFALLFLKRANFADDLTTLLKGRLHDGGERTLRARGSNKSSIRSGIELKSPELKANAKLPDTESGRLAADFLKASVPQQREMLEKMRSAKGVKYTEALAAAIPRLDGELRQKARDALAERLTRMKADTLVQYLEDEDTEIRRAAALACGMKPAKELIPNLIALLRDAQKPVVAAAHAALKELTGKDFGPASGASREDCDRAAVEWLTWWDKQHKKSESRP